MSKTVVNNGDTVDIHYTGTFNDTGKTFDSSHDRGKPLRFKMGAHNVITGMEEGVMGMRVGEKKKIVCPPEKAYGSRGCPGVIPPDSTLVFDVEVVSIQ